MVRLTIDDKIIDAKEGTTILEAARSVGIEIPHFCYHPHLTIAGNCRLCLVEVEGARNLVISCKEPVRQDMIVHTDTEVVKKARADVLEFVLINHPLDCPICDQAGECKLQDYYFEHSLRPSRLRDEKVHKPKKQVVGPYVILDSERCVECTRCIRFCEEITGRHEIGLFERSDQSTINVLSGESLANPYSLCTVDLCPVGALTSTDFRFKKRVWYLKSTPSVCLGCATGCNIWIDHADSIVYRFRPRENDAVNKSWLCDYGRMTYKKLLAENRVLAPLVKKGGLISETGWDEAAKDARRLFDDGKHKKIVGILSAVSSVEDNESIVQALRDKLNVDEFYWAQCAPDPNFGDRILRSEDMNPNLRCVEKLALRRASPFEEGVGYVILDGLPTEDIFELQDSKPAWIVVIASQKSGEAWFDLALPKASYFETGGTFINKDGISQSAERAFLPLGASMPVNEIVRSIFGE